MTRILTTALSALFTLTATVAFAAPSVVTADSILVREDTVRLEYNSKTGGCAALFDQDMNRLQDSPFHFCDQGTELVVELPIEHFDLEGGDTVQLCDLVFGQCSDRITVRQAGDVNDDGDINVIDLQIIHGYILGNGPRWWPEAEIDLEAADLNGDGEVNVIDIIILLDYIWN